jgi:ribosomal protein S3
MGSGCNIIGLKLMIKGRLNGNERKSVLSYVQGSMPLQSKIASVSFFSSEAITPYGICSIKLYVNYKN